MPSAERTAPGRARAIAITPDQIERRAFTVEEQGFDREEVRKYLAEVAATLRMAQRSTMPPVLVPLTAGTGGGLAPDETAAFDRVSAEVTRILRAAEVSATARRDETDALVTAIIEQAERDADDLRQQALVDATIETDRARRVLVAAQEQAQSIVAEAEARATAMLDAARDHARQHARQIATEARRRADEVAESEAAVLRRLNEARLDLVEAIDALSSTRTRSVVDVTGTEPSVRLESQDLVARDADRDSDEPAAIGTTNASDDTGDIEPIAIVRDDASEREAARSLIQRAVARAAAAATADPGTVLDALGASRARLVPVRPSVNRRAAQRPADAARPCHSADTPTPAAGRPATAMAHDDDRG